MHFLMQVCEQEGPTLGRLQGEALDPTRSCWSEALQGATGVRPGREEPDGRCRRRSREVAFPAAPCFPAPHAL